MSEARIPDEDTIDADEPREPEDNSYDGPDPEEDPKGDEADEDQGT